jgi:hypothetical protein
MYEFKYRFDDPQIGRFWSVDPLANKYVYNSPYAFSENKVTGHIELEGLEAVNANDSRDPKVRALFRENVQKEVNASSKNLSESGSIKVSIGPGVGISGGVGKVKLEAVVSGPQAEVTLKPTSVEAQGSVLSGGVKASTPIGNVKSGATFGLVKSEDGKLTFDFVNTGTSGKLASASQETKSGNMSGEIAANPNNGELTVGAKIGVIGVEIMAAPLNLAKGVFHAFGAFIEYTKEVIKENMPLAPSSNGK